MRSVAHGEVVPDGPLHTDLKAPLDINMEGCNLKIQLV
jgi:hypothetical protein